MHSGDLAACSVSNPWRASLQRSKKRERFMAEWAQVRRVVIIVDTAIEAPILEYVMKAGARGYNCIYCFGKGRHEVLEAPFTGSSRVRIEVLVREEVAESIMDFVHEPHSAPFRLRPSWTSSKSIRATHTTSSLAATASARSRRLAALPSVGNQFHQPPARPPRRTPRR